MKPATYDFSVVRGSAGPGQGLKVKLKVKDDSDNEINLDFDDVRLSIYKRNTYLLRCTLANGKMVVTDPTEAEVEWVPTTEDTRKLQAGAKNIYELEVRNGTYEAIYMIGTINGIGGINDDLDGTNEQPGDDGEDVVS
jgi:hypothetical protein